MSMKKAMIYAMISAFLVVLSGCSSTPGEAATPVVNEETVQLTQESDKKEAQEKETSENIEKELDAPTVKEGVLTPHESYSGVYFEWNEIEGADGYEVSTESKFYSDDAYGNPEIEEVKDNNYEAGAQDLFDFRIKVRAFAGKDNDRSYSEWSAYATGSAYDPNELSADEYYFLSKEQDPEDILANYTISLMENGKYFDFEGNLDEIMDCYRNKDLNDDGKPDKINRIKETGDYGDGYCYEISFSDGTSFKTKVFSGFNGEGEVIEYKDINNDGIAEILFTHYTGSTVGPEAWDIYLYYYDGTGEWQVITIADEYLKLTEVAETCGFKLNVMEGPRLVGVELVDDGIAMLIDYGHKDGAAQEFDYEVVTLTLDNGMLSVSEHSKELVKVYWPLVEN